MWQSPRALGESLLEQSLVGRSRPVKTFAKCGKVLLRPIRGKEMQRVNEFVFYELAIKVHSLTEEPDEVKYSDVWWRWSQARDALDEIFQQRPLNFTTSVATKLYQAINQVIPEKFEERIAKLPKQGNVDPESDLQYWNVFQVREAAKEFETVLRNE